MIILRLRFLFCPLGQTVRGEHYHYSRSHGQLFRIFYGDSTGKHSCTAPSSPAVSLAPLRSLQVGSSGGTCLSTATYHLGFTLLCEATLSSPTYEHSLQVLSKALTMWYSTLLSTTSPGRTKRCLHFHSYSGALAHAQSRPTRTSSSSGPKVQGPM
jgi:hypothetical protein